MLTADVLKRQKSGLMLRLAEQTRALADARERADQLAAERAQHTAAVAAVAQAWAELDSNLANFAARLAPLDSARTLASRRARVCVRLTHSQTVDSTCVRIAAAVVGGAGWLTGRRAAARRQLRHGSRVCLSLLHSCFVFCTVAAELAARTQRSRHVLQAVAVALAQRGDAGQAQFETLSAQFVTVSKAYEGQCGSAPSLADALVFLTRAPQRVSSA